jgi:hypothetical protein
MSIAKIARELFEQQQQREEDRKGGASKGGPALFMSNIDGDSMRVSIYGVSSDEIYSRVVQVLSDLDKEIQAANRV